MLGSSTDRRAKVNKVIWRIFTKKYGITLQQEAVDFLITKLASSHDDDLEDIEQLIEYVAMTYSKQADRKDLVDLAGLQSTVDAILKSALNREDFGAIDVRDYVHVVQAFDCAKWNYDPHSKQFCLLNESKTFLCKAEDKIKAFVRRFEFAKQRLLRHDRFADSSSTQTFSMDTPSDRLKLSPIKSIKGQSMSEPKYVLGILSQMVEGQWFLEDPEEFIRLDLSKVQNVLEGYYTENSLVLVEGWPRGETFEVCTIGMAPAESAALTRSLQTFPDPLAQAVKDVESPSILRQMLAQQAFSHILFFSDMHLDNSTLLDRFGAVLREYASDPPAVIVLMGHFLVKVPPEGPQALQAYEAAFEGLANVIASVKTVRESTRFVLVPGQEDAFYPNILPRPALPDDIFDSLAESRIDFVAATNPCRIKCFTREIVIMRQNAHLLLERCKLSEILHQEHCTVAQTLLDQGHLSPLPLSVQPIQWNMDNALSLYPVPDLLCIGDNQTASAIAHNGCQFVNPGEFFRSGLAYVQYFPCSNRIEFKHLED